MQEIRREILPWNTIQLELICVYLVSNTTRLDTARKVTIFHDVGSAKQTCLHLGRATKRVEIDEQIFCAVLLGYFWEMKKNQQLWVCLHPHIMNIEHIHVVDLGQKSSKVLYFAFSWRWPIFQREEVMGYGSSPALVVILTRKEGAYLSSAINESDISTCRVNATSYHRWCMMCGIEIELYSGLLSIHSSPDLAKA